LWLLSFYAERQTAEVWWNGTNDKELDPVDRERFDRLTNTYFWINRTLSFAWNRIDGGGEGAARNLAAELSEQPGLLRQFNLLVLGNASKPTCGARSGCGTV
jgi:hypothetical protein